MRLGNSSFFHCDEDPFVFLFFGSMKNPIGKGKSVLVLMNQDPTSKQTNTLNTRMYTVLLFTCLTSSEHILLFGVIFCDWMSGISGRVWWHTLLVSKGVPDTWAPPSFGHCSFILHSHEPHHLLQHNYMHQWQGTLSNERPPHLFATIIFLRTSSWQSFWAEWYKKTVTCDLCQSYHHSSRGMITSGSPRNSHIELLPIPMGRITSIN